MLNFFLSTLSVKFITQKMEDEYLSEENVKAVALISFTSSFAAAGKSLIFTLQTKQVTCQTPSMAFMVLSVIGCPQPLHLGNMLLV